MPTHPHDPTDPGDKLAAVRVEMREEVTGAIRDAREAGRREERDREWANERQHTVLTPAPVVTHSDVKLAISEKCESCQRPGGAIHELASEVKGLATEVKAAVLTMAEQRGEKRSWAVIRAAAGAVALAVLGFTLNHFAAKRSDDTLQRQIEVAAQVAKKLKALEDATKGHTELEYGASSDTRIAQARP